MNFTWVVIQGALLALKGQFDEAMVQLEKCPPAFPPAALGLWTLYWQRQEYEKALASCRHSFAQHPHRDIVLAALAQATSAEGMPEAQHYSQAMRLAAEALVARRTGDGPYVQPTLIASFFVHSGNRDEALRWLERAFQERDPQLVHLVGPVWRDLYAEPRFQKIAQKMKIPINFTP